jgi:hypothetical protein
MSAQAAIAAKTAVSALSFTGTAFSIAPRGKDANNVLAWVNAGTTSLQDSKVDFSYRLPTTSRKTTKATLRAFSPKTYTDSTTGQIVKVGDSIASIDFTFPDGATSTERALLVDILTTTLGAAEFRLALINGDVMY